MNWTVALCVLGVIVFAVFCVLVYHAHLAWELEKRRRS